MSQEGTATGRKLLYTDVEVGEMIGISPRTLQGWRLKGVGPAFVRAGKRNIRYRLEDIEAWAAENRCPIRPFKAEDIERLFDEDVEPWDL